MRASRPFSAVPALLLLTVACGSSSSSSGGGGTEAANKTSTEAVVTAICNQRQKCDPDGLKADYRDVTNCVTVITAGVATDLPGLSFTSADVQACAAALTAATCETSFDDVPACRLKGSLANGAACSSPNQCSSAYCQVADNAVCGKCAPVAADGAACVDALGCNVSSDCDPTAKKCAPRIAKGAACTSSGVACQVGFRCVASLCTTPLPAGSACNVADDSCANGLVCLQSVCTDAAKISSVVDVGAACGLNPTTNTEAFCSFSSCVSAKCVAFAEVGETCSVDNGTTALTNPACSPNLDCESGKCVQPVLSVCK